jgi:hypothetical protein
MSLRTAPSPVARVVADPGRRIRARRRLRNADLMVALCWSSVAMAVAL